MFRISRLLRLVHFILVSTLGCSVLVGAGYAAAMDTQDAFNRADGALGTNWANLPEGGVVIASGRVVGTRPGNSSGSYRIDGAYNNDQYSEITVTSSPLSVWIGASVRNQNGNFYMGIYYANGGSPQLMIYKRVGGAWTQLGASYNCGTLAVGTKLRLMVMGTTLAFLQDGVERISVSDADITAGAPGIVIWGTDALDDWSGGDVALYAVGGTVSGLTGTLVVQNNGGETQTLTQNGAFRFATPLVDGAAYAVTVLSHPGNQTCTVLNGSGTVTGHDVDTVTIVCTTNSTAPVVAQSDDFNRADGALGTNWANLPEGGVVIASGQVVGTRPGNSSGSYRIDGAYNNDQYSEITVTSSPLSVWIGASVRNQNGNFYMGIYYANGGSPQLMIYKRVGGAWTQLGASYNCGTLAVGTKLRLMVMGTTLAFLQDGVERISVSDADITAGAPGIVIWGTDALDDWSGGDVALYAVGGTVSGLTGTLVVQNNGGETQTLTQNGAFRFATPLVDGAAYAVTVLSHPGNQTCTVLNGSGTVTGHDVDTVTIVCTTNSTAPVVAQSDDFNRADGALGTNWANLPEGGVVIASGQVVGTRPGNSSGSYRIDGSYNNDQYSEITVTSSPLSVWIGASVRNQNGNFYMGIYYANGGSPQLMIYKRVGGAWAQLGVSYNCGTLAVGTKLRLMVMGTTLAFLQDGVERISVSDADITAGAPGIVIWGTDALDNWAGGNAVFEAHYLSTDPNGIESYHMFSKNNGYGPHVLRVLRPDNPAPGVAHHFLYVLPVEPEGGTLFGDGLTTLRELNAQNQYNVTLIAPSFPIDPWYADHPTNANYKFESFMCLELQPWVTTNLASTGSEQHWLLGFSKSGVGGLDLLFKHPDRFTLGAFWDFPATGFTTFDQFGASSAANYGTDANFQANYRLTTAFVQTYKNPFLTDNRLWISGYQAFQQDVADFDVFLTATGVVHTFPTPVLSPNHSWDSGWVPQAVDGLFQNSIHLGNQ